MRAQEQEFFTRKIKLFKIATGFRPWTAQISCRYCKGRDTAGATSAKISQRFIAMMHARDRAPVSERCIGEFRHPCATGCQYWCLTLMMITLMYWYFWPHFLGWWFRVQVNGSDGQIADERSRVHEAGKYKAQNRACVWIVLNGWSPGGDAPRRPFLFLVIPSKFWQACNQR